MSVICRKFYETRLEDVDVTKTQPCMNFAYIQAKNNLQFIFGEP